MPRRRLFVAVSVVVLVVMVRGTGWAQTIDGVGANSGVGTKTPAAASRRTVGIISSIEEATCREVLRLSAPDADSRFRAAQQPSRQKRSWIRRHPALFGALVGFGSGFLIGYLPGDDAVFDDFTAGFNGLVLGGVGGLAGAVVGEVATH